MAYEITQAIFDNTIERANDMTAMQDKDTTYSAVTTGTDLVFSEASASITSGALTTVTTAGVITIGRIGKFKLSVDGSFHASGATDFELQVHLNTGGGYADTGFGVVRTISNNSDGSFSATFHGTRAVGDLIKIIIVSGTSRDITFNGVAVMTEWMS